MEWRPTRVRLDDGVGFAKIVALGNKADVNEVELLEFLGRDPETRVVAMLLESISDGRRLFEAAAAVTPKKPVVLLKTGRHPDAQRAAASHTAALSGDAAVAFAALRQAGVHLVEDGLRFSTWPLPSIANRPCAAAISASSPIRAARAWS